MQRMSCQLAVILTAIRLSQSFGSMWESGDSGPRMPALPTSTSSRPVALVEREREPRDAVAVLHVERHQRGGAAGGLDLVVELLQPADGARDGDDMRAGLRQCERDGRANAARGAGDQRDTVGEGFGSSASAELPAGQMASASNDNCRGLASCAPRSVSAVG